MQRAIRLMVTMRKPLLRTRTLRRWVLFSLYYVIVTSNLYLVLNPKEKMSHFKKHWSEDLQDDVLECLEKVVRLIFTIVVIISIISYSSKSGIYNKSMA